MVGVEIGSDRVSVAWSKGVQAENGWRELTGFVSMPATAAQRHSVLGEIVASRGLKGALCNLALPAEQYQVFQVEKPAVEDSEIVDAIKWKVKDLIDYPVEDAVVDVFGFPVDALRGRAPMVNVVCARKAMLQDQVKLLAAVGLKLKSIDISELVLRNIAMRFDPETKGIALLFLRGTHGSVLMCKGGELYFHRRVDFVVEALNDLMRQEELIQQLALHVQRSLDYYESQMGQLPPAQLLVFKVSDEVALGAQLGSYLAVKVVELDAQALLVKEEVALETLNESLVAIGAALRQEGP